VGSAVAGPEWAGIKAAEGDAKHKVVTSKKWGDAEFEYNTLARSGQKFGSNTFGMITDKKGGEIEVSHNPDFASILTKYDGKLYMVTQFESPRPGVAYFSELEQDADGKLKMVSASPMDFSSMGGLWIPCAGSVSPWGSHIGSEEYEPDARAFFSSENPTENGNIKDFMRYFPDASGSSPDDLVASGFNPYFYGYAWETKVADGKPITEKWYTQGRMSWELPYGMPDRKTVYGTDDGENVMFSKFEAKKAGDMSEGTLYCARMTQVRPAIIPSHDGMVLEKEVGKADDAYFKITWQSMGSAKSADIYEEINSYNGTGVHTKFSDLFKTGDLNKDGDGCEDEDYTMIRAGGNKPECLKLQKGFDDDDTERIKILASRLEKRRYAAYIGCTVEGRKWEGITYDPKSRTMFTALSSIERGMEKSEKAYDGKSKTFTPADHIQLKANSCGCVFEMGFNGPDDYSIGWMKALVCGFKNESHPLAADNKCSVDGIASPDNVAAIPEHGQLIIGEDTSSHQNDMVWVRDNADGKLTRVATTPYGSETTSPYWYPNINGHSYITLVVQHPYGESDEDKAGDAESTGVEGWVGYMGPLPKVSKVESGASATAASMVLSVFMAAVALFAL